MKRSRICLRPWEEVVGILQEVKDSNYCIKFILSNKHNQELEIVFPKFSLETNFEELTGKAVGVLRTDEPRREVLTRKIRRRRDYVASPRVGEQNCI